MSFEGLAATTTAPMQSPQATPEPTAADDGTADERLRLIIAKMRPELGS